MSNPNTLINVLGIAYGLVLILAAFVDNKFLSAMRIDSLFMKGASQQTRPLNLLFGALVIGYAVYSLMTG